MRPLECPTPEELAALHSGRLPQDRLDDIEAHLDDCARCLSWLDNQGAESDPLLADLRHVGPAGPDPEESERLDSRSRPPEAGDQETARPALSIGDRLGVYRVLGIIGRGGMGDVYQALHEPLDRVVALKVLPADRHDDPQFVARFEREWTAIGRLEHPNIVAARDAGKAGGVRFLVMEYVEGQDLSKVVRRHGPLGSAEACEVARQTARALEYADRKGVVHRDIKPSNLLLTVEGRVKVADFGIARLRGDRRGGANPTLTGPLLGTPLYMAPEQASAAHEVDVRADLYSLGCTLYHMLAGRAPFAEHRESWRQLQAQVEQPPPSILKVRTDVPARVAAVLARLMAKDPADRYQTPAELAAALEPLARGHRLAALAGATDDPAVPARDDLRGLAPVRGSAAAPDPQTSAPGHPQPPRARARGRRTAVFALTLLVLGAAFIAWQVRERRGKEDHTPTPPNGPDLARPIPEAVVVPKIEPPAPRQPTAEPVPAPTLAAQPPAERVKLLPQPTRLKRGDPLSPAAVVTRPFPIDGIISWTIETREPRGRVTCLAFRPGGGPIAVGDDSGTIRLFEHKSAKLTRAIVTGHETVEAIAWSPDGRLLAAEGFDFRYSYGHVIQIWDVDQVNLVNSRFVQDDQLDKVWAWSPDGRVLASGGEGVELWNVFDDRSRKLHAPGRTHALAWAPDGGRLATGGDGIRVWEVEPKGRLKEVKIPRSPSSLEWSPDGKALASLSGLTVDLWDAGTGEHLKTMDHDKTPSSNNTEHIYVGALSWARDGHTLLSAAGATVQLWDPRSGKPDRTPLRLSHPLSISHVALALADDGEVAVASSGTNERYEDELIFWDIKTLKAGYTIASNPRIFETSWSPKQERFGAVTGSDTVELIAIEPTPVRQPSPNPPSRRLEVSDREMAWSPRQNMLAFVAKNNRLNVLDCDSGQVRTLDAGLCRVVWSPDGTTIATLSDNGNLFGGCDVALVDAVSGKMIRRLGLSGGANSWIFAWSPDGKTLATAQSGLVGSVKLFETATGRCLRTTADDLDDVRNLAWSPDGTRLAWSQSKGKLQIWDASKGQNLGGFTTFDINEKSCTLKWSRDGQSIKSLSSFGFFSEWNTAGEHLHGWPMRLQGTFLPDGQIVACYDLVLRLRATATGEPILTIVPCAEGRYIRVSPDGHFLGEPGVERSLVYVAQTESAQRTLTPDEFRDKFGWRNDEVRALLPWRGLSPKPAEAAHQRPQAGTNTLVAPGADLARVQGKWRGENVNNGETWEVFINGTEITAKIESTNPNTPHYLAYKKGRISVNEILGYFDLNDWSTWDGKEYRGAAEHQGLYRLSQDTLHLRVGDDRKPRPTEFPANPRARTNSPDYYPAQLELKAVRKEGP